MDAFKKECDLWMLAESVSVYQVLNVLHDDMFKQYKWKTWYQVQVRKYFVHITIMHWTSFCGAQNMV